jgi:hypothetical protein
MRSLELFKMRKNMKTTKGHCLCKSVSFQFQTKELEFDACHCSMCRRWGGGPGMGVTASHLIEMSGEEYIQLYSSSDWAERAFCRKCGTHLFYRLKDKSFTNFQLGTLENNDEYKFKLQIFVDSKPSNYSFADNTKKMTEAEVLAVFSKKT